MKANQYIKNIFIYLLLFLQHAVCISQNHDILDEAVDILEKTHFFSGMSAPEEMPYGNFHYYIKQMLTPKERVILSNTDTLFLIESIDVTTMYNLSILNPPYIFKMYFTMIPPFGDIYKICRYLPDYDFSYIYDISNVELHGVFQHKCDSVQYDAYFINTNGLYYKTEKTVLAWNKKVFRQMRKRRIRGRIIDDYVNAVRIIRHGDGTYHHEIYDYPDQSNHFYFKDYMESAERNRNIYLNENGIIKLFLFKKNDNI